MAREKTELAEGEVVQVRLPRETLRTLRKMARENDRTLSQEIRRAVRQYALREMGEGSKSA